MLHGKYIPIEGYKNSTEKNGFQYLYKKDDELKVDFIIDKNESVIEQGNDFVICKFIQDRDQ